MAATTDFVSAQKANRRNTMVLLVALTALAALVGYVIGWLLESEASNSVPLLSKGGVAAAGLLAAVSVGWSALSPKASDSPLQPTLTIANRPATATPPLLKSGTAFDASLSSSQPIT